MGTSLFVRVLVQAGAVKGGQPVNISREVRWYPVQNHADARFVQLVHKIHEVLGRAVSGGRRIITDNLIAPGCI